MSPALPYARRTKRGFPRVSGDEPAIPGDDAEAIEFSPRERG